MEFIGYIKRCKLVNTEAAFCLAEELFVVKLAAYNLFTLIALEPFDALAILPQSKLERLGWYFVRA